MTPTRSHGGPSRKRLAEWAAVIGGDVPCAESDGDPSDGTDGAA
jgi:hypothetical protein